MSEIETLQQLNQRYERKQHKTLQFTKLGLQPYGEGTLELYELENAASLPKHVRRLFPDPLPMFKIRSMAMQLGYKVKVGK